MLRVVRVPDVLSASTTARSRGSRSRRGLARARATATGSRAGRRDERAGTFMTAPAADRERSDPLRLLGRRRRDTGPDGKPGFNSFQVYGRMATEKNDFNINLGDTIYSDSELAGSKPALTVAEKWQKYRLRPRAPESPQAPCGSRPLQPAGTITSSSTTSPVPSSARRCTRRGSGRSSTTRRSRTRRRTVSTGPSAGGRTSSSSFSTSGRSGAPRRPQAGRATSPARPTWRRPRPRPCAPPSPR